MARLAKLKGPLEFRYKTPNGTEFCILPAGTTVQVILHPTHRIVKLVCGEWFLVYERRRVDKVLEYI